MKLVEKENCFLIEDFFPLNIIAGFTKPSLKGVLPEDIKEIMSSLGINPDVSSMNQRHSAEIFQVNKPGVYEGDAIFTRQKNHVLVVKTADCLPIIFCSEDTKVIGVIHMGWRSADKGIFENIYKSVFNNKNENTVYKIALGPGLRSCCYKVGTEFLNYPKIKDYLELRKNNLYFDPVKAVKQYTVKNDYNKFSFYDTGVCTFCSDKGFFSYRKFFDNNRTLSFISNN
ncbi:MAG: polyphenol oxidase family protein [Candidatus Omnitrophica bacterium]|nr:polyphenol oxidase family protein [Candidatus Omnitrophota bacterium]